MRVRLLTLFTLKEIDIVARLGVTTYPMEVQ
jgi:hypothetical protein